MNLLTRIRGALSAFRNETYKQDGTWLSDWARGGWGETDSGVYVNAKNGIGIPTVWKCVNWRQNQFGMLPKKIKERVEIFGRPAQKEAPSHPLFRIVHDNPNPTITAKAYWGLVSADLHLWGNHYAYIETSESSGRTRNLWRFWPERVKVEDGEDQIRYKVYHKDGTSEIFLQDEIFHVPGLGYDGVRGYSPMHLMRQALGWNVATERYGAQFFKNASRMSAVISVPQPLKPEAKKALIESLQKTGKEAGKVALIEGQATVSQLTMDQNDAQFIETAQFQEEYIVGMMGVPQHKVQILRRSTNNNIEHQGIEAVTDCLQPLAVEVEQCVALQLMSDRPSSGIGGGTERQRFFMDTELKALMRGDTAAQTAHVVAMIEKGVYSQNDARDYLGLQPVDGGDDYWMNLAYAPIDLVRELSESKANPAEPEPTDEPQMRLRLELQARVAKAYGKLFRNAVGKTLARSKDRERYVSGVFRPLLEALAECLGAEELQEEFLLGYLSALGKRSLDWTEDGKEATATTELERAVNALLEKRV